MQGRLVAGRYRLAEAIGSGGMGRVWRAHDELLHRAVAVKELTAAHYVSESDRERLLARTQAEARAAARINHSAVVTIHDVLDHDGRPWIVMELVEGRSLADAVTEDGRIEPAEAARIGLWVLRALRAAHTAGVLHRDVKPGNVLLADDGRVLLTDFGIAQIEGDSTITRTGEVVGSVDYLAPERVRGQDPGPASDLWALGATLYTAVEGRSPFRRTSPLSTLQAVVEEEAEETRYAGPLGHVITALLRKDPATRPATAEAERLLAEAAEGRGPGGPGGPGGAQVFVPAQYGGPDTATTAPVGPAGAGGPAGPGGRTLVGPPHHNAHIGPNGHPGHAGPGGHFAHVPAYGAPRTSARPSRRRRLRILALVVAVAALVGGGTAVVLQQYGAGGRSHAGESGESPSPSTSAGASASGTPSDSASATPTSQDGLPRSWEPITDPLGFGLSLPKGWERELFQDDGDLKQVDYTPDGGEHFVRIAIDTSPDFDSAHAHQRDLDQQLQRLVDYKAVTLEENVYRDREGSEWEYTWTALAKDTEFPGPRRAVEEAYIARDGTEYIIYMSSPAEDWERTAEQFRSVLRSWREPGAS
ncbi:serine/threonine-protein kinase [Streptomyces antibioticus]|uniref:serine/threonine-protein kinase n=1 Tax=Streptomyces antibioticus TaxID=1890 RepID=UPI00367D0320